MRAQCAAVSAPLVGDVTYTPTAGLLVGASGELDGGPALAQLNAMRQQEGPVGLHACQLEWEGRVLHAPAPWHC
jgi:hypothetical protein